MEERKCPTTSTTKKITEHDVDEEEKKKKKDGDEKTRKAKEEKRRKRRKDADDGCKRESKSLSSAKKRGEFFCFLTHLSFAPMELLQRDVSEVDGEINTNHGRVSVLSRLRLVTRFS